MTGKADLWPLTLGICRDCEACRMKLIVTLEGTVSGAVYYCMVTMHETDGTERCTHYQPEKP